MKKEKFYKVLSVSINGKFSQYCMYSEIRLFSEILKDGKVVTFRPCELSESSYKFNFGK